MKRGVEKIWNFALAAVLAYFAFQVIGGPANPGAIAVIMAAAILAPFVVGPILVHSTHWSSLDPGLVSFDPAGPESPDILRSHFAKTCAELDRLGFVPERYFRTGSLRPSRLWIQLRRRNEPRTAVDLEGGVPRDMETSATDQANPPPSGA